MAEAPDTTTPYVYKTLGTLEAKAERASKDIESIRTAMDALPGQIEEILNRLMEPMTEKIEEVERELADVQGTVTRWKGALGLFVVVSLVGGWLVANYVSLRHFIGLP
jgi:hypothetical protein